jgi:hypothetical protein
MSLDYEEKRDFPRMRLNCTAQFTDLASGEAFEQMALNLSGGGVLFVADDPLPAGTRLRMRVEPGGGPAGALEAVISVRRAEPRAQGGYQVAAVIESIEGGGGG